MHVFLYTEGIFSSIKHLISTEHEGNLMFHCFVLFFLLFLVPLQIELIDRVDDIYRNTTWDDEFKGYGVQIHQVCVCVCVIPCTVIVQLTSRPCGGLSASPVTSPGSMIASLFIVSFPEVKLSIMPSLIETEKSILGRHWKLLCVCVCVSWGNLICSTGFGNEWRHCFFIPWIPGSLTEKICIHFPIFLIVNIKTSM